jgi:hypothetical protein
MQRLNGNGVEATIGAREGRGLGERSRALLPLVGLVGLVACGSSASPSGGTPASDGGPDAAEALPDGASPGPDSGFVPGAPITATSGQWTWVPFDDAFCGDGSPTGLGINPSTTSTRVLIYLEGGGACWDALTCYTLMTAANFGTGYSQANFVTESTDLTYLALPGGFFDRTAAANPFKDYSYVYLPYCTGDVFSGNNVAALGTNTAHFVGYANVAAYLARLVPTFPAADRVILAGSSAGGYGAIFNAWQAQAAFGSVRVDVLDDSGTFLPPDVLAEGSGSQTTQSTAWNLPATSPPCSTCSTDPSAIYGAYAAAFPTHRGALLSYTQDSVLPTFFGITTAQFTTGLDEDLTAEFAGHANLQAFVFDGPGHVLFFDPQLTQNGVTLQTFVTQMATDSSAWATVQP